MSSVNILPPNNAVIWYLNEMEKAYDYFAYYLEHSGRTFFRIKPDGSILINGNNDLFLAMPMMLEPVSQEKIDDSVKALESTYNYYLNVYLANQLNDFIDPKDDKQMQTLERQMLSYIFGVENIVLNDDENKENEDPCWFDDAEMIMTEYEPEDMSELDPEQVATNVSVLMSELNIALEPSDMQELIGEPTLCHLLLGPEEEGEEAWRNTWKDDGILPTPLGLHLLETDFSENEYDNHELYHPF